MSDAETIASFIQSILTSAAILGSGLWAYFHYFKGRTYRPRLEPSTNCRVIPGDNSLHLLLSANLKNVGLSRVDIQQEGTALQVYSAVTAQNRKDTLTAEWELLATFPLFEDHQWIEPGETIDDARLVLVPNVEHFVFNVTMRVVAKRIAWKAFVIVERTSSSTESPKGDGS